MIACGLCFGLIGQVLGLITAGVLGAGFISALVGKLRK